jgi:cell division control protein 6
MSDIFREDGEKIFDPNYLPEELPHREEQFDHLKNILLDGLYERRYSVPVLYGESGTGKTTTVRKVFEELSIELRGGENIETHVLNATTHSKTYVAIRELANKIVPIPERGFSIDEIILKLYNRLDIEDLKYIIAIDDADELVRRDKGKILDILTRINENYRRRLIYPVIVLRKIEILAALPTHITSSLGGERIEFPTYTKNHLKDILKERIDKGLKLEAITINAIEAASYASEKIFIGNARELLNIVYKAGKNAELNRDTQITAEHIRKAIYDSYTKSFRPDFLIDKRREGNLLKILWATTKLIADNQDVYWLEEDMLREAYNLYQRSFQDKISFQEFRNIIEKIAEEDSKIITFDNGKLVFLGYPGKKMYEELTKNIFFRG